MLEKFKEEKPVYIQLAEQLKYNIVNGLYKVGEKLPTVRELALKFNVNPNTMLKALSLLEREKLICKKSKAKYITQDYKLVIENKRQLTQLEINNILQNLKYLGFQSQDIRVYLLEILEKK